MIYEPREDSFLLQKFVKQFVKGKVLDVGTGSGIQALTALEKTADVVASDINAECVEFVKAKGVKTIVSDLFSNINSTFDVIIFNPPYLPLDEREDKESALSTTGGVKGSEVLERFLEQAKAFLNAKGKILIVVSSLTPDVPALLKKYKYSYKVLGEEKVSFELLTVYLLEK
tara:strand:+ start:11660 stop:12175 length:516 start_codon:yes stop_codon:yes gene_type:complete